MPTTRAVVNPADLAEAAELQELVALALAELRPRTRDVLSMHFLGGLKIREVAAALGMPPGRISVIKCRGIVELRNVLACRFPSVFAAKKASTLRGRR